MTIWLVEHDVLGSPQSAKRRSFYRELNSIIDEAAKKGINVDRSTESVFVSDDPRIPGQNMRAC